MGGNSGSLYQLMVVLMMTEMGGNVQCVPGGEGFSYLTEHTRTLARALPHSKIY